MIIMNDDSNEDNKNKKLHLRTVKKTAKNIYPIYCMYYVWFSDHT